MQPDSVLSQLDTNLPQACHQRDRLVMTCDVVTTRMRNEGGLEIKRQWCPWWSEVFCLGVLKCTSTLVPQTRRHCMMQDPFHPLVTRSNGAEQRCACWSRVRIASERWFCVSVGFEEDPRLVECTYSSSFQQFPSCSAAAVRSHVTRVSPRHFQRETRTCDVIAERHNPSQAFCVV
jgi:hypothetical protein